MNDFGGTFRAAAEAMPGISSGQLRIVGSVVRYAAGPMKGKIHSYLQETGMVGSLLGSLEASGATFAQTTLATGNPVAGAVTAGTQIASTVPVMIQNEVIRQGVAQVAGQVNAIAAGMSTLTTLGMANLALAGTGIGIILVGFGIMNSRLSRIENALATLA